MHWKPKRIIQSWLDEIILNGRMYVSPSECMELLKDIEIDEREVWNYFMELTKDGQLLFKAMVICHHDDKSIEPLILKEFVHFMKGEQVTIDLHEELEKGILCPTCHKEIIVNLKNLVALFSPTDDYIRILEEEQNQPRKNRLKLHE